MPRVLCPFRVKANAILQRLRRAGLERTKLYQLVAREFDRDLYTGVSRLHLALPKVAVFMTALEEAGRSRPRRRAALSAIRDARLRVR